MGDYVQSFTFLTLSVAPAEIKYDEATRRLSIPVNTGGVRATLSIEIPSDFPFGHPKARVKFNEDTLEPEQIDKLEELQKDVSKTCKQSDIALSDVVETFVAGAFLRLFPCRSRSLRLVVSMIVSRVLKAFRGFGRDRGREKEEERKIGVENSEP